MTFAQCDRLEAYPACLEMTMYKNTPLSLLVCLFAAILAPAAEPDILIADFEWETWEGSGWTVTGEAFGPGPARGTLPNQMQVTGYKGARLVNSYEGGDGPTGTLTSPRFTIERDSINFLIGGGGFEGKTCMNLLVDGQVVRTATGPNTKPGGSERLDWRMWDVRDLAGKEAVLQIVDAHSGGWGHINVDHIVQSNQPKALVFRVVDLGEPATALPAEALAPLLEAIQKKELAERYEEKAAREKLGAADVQLGAWYRIGPFRDQPPLLSWMENVESSFRHEFEAETDMRDHGHAPRLDKQYPAENFPATPGAARRWTVQPEWIDGYLCDLPRGPAPSAGETQYVYRTITASAPVTVEMDFAVRAPASDRKLDGPYQEWWRRKARYRCLLNGEEVLRFEGDGPFPGRVALELRAGANHFLAKITNNRHSYGFSFALAGLHPAPRRPGAHEEPWRPFERRRAGDVPYYCETDPSRRKPVVEMTFDACLGQLAEMAGRRPEDMPDMLGADPHEDGWAAKVRDAYVAAYRYREALVRLRDFRFFPAPMPGIESAVRDSRGRIVTPMEKALEGYPVSPGAARYAERVESLRREVEPLLERLVDSGRPEFAAVLRLDQAIGAMGVGSAFYAHRLVGLVPVEEDGSAHFEVPALRSLYFHALDQDGKMLMTMGSDMHVLPGEARSCVGCHEHRRNIHAPPVARPTIAAGKPPVRPELPPWGTRGILEYEAVVQPVFDTHCVECHGGSRPEGGLDLTGSRTTAFNMSYMELVDKGLVHFVPGAGHTHAQPSLDYDKQAPLSRGSLLSKLTPYLDDPEHSGARVPWDERYRVHAWIDANVPFYSHYTQQSPTILKQDARKALADVYQRRCAACHDQRPRPDAIHWLSPWHIWTHVPPQPGQWNIADSGMRVRHLNLTAPGHSAALQAPLAKEAGGLEWCAGPDGAPVFRDKADNDYQEILEALSNGVIHRTGTDFQGVQEILRQLE